MVELSHQVSWDDAALNVCFCMGLDADMISYYEPACYFSLVQSINLILYLNSSYFEVEEIQTDHSSYSLSSETHAAAPAQLTPMPSSYPVQ